MRAGLKFSRKTETQKPARIITTSLKKPEKPSNLATRLMWRHKHSLLWLYAHL